MRAVNVGKKVIAISMAVMMALTAFAVTPALTGGKVYATSTVAETTSSVNVRSDASTDAKIITTFPKGKTFTVKGVKKDSSGTYWYKTTYNSKTGYVSSKYAVRTGFNTTTITKKIGKVTADGINVRLGPGTGYLSIGKASKGTSYYVTGKATDSSGKTWYRIIYSGNFKAYISGTYISFSSSSSISTENNDDSTDSSTTDSSSTSTLKGKTNSACNMRSDAGTKNKIVAKIAKNKTVTITGMKKASDGKFWFAVQYGSKNGYVSSGRVARTGYKTTTVKTKKGTVKYDGIKIRLGPGTSNPAYTTLNKGTSLKVTGKASDSNGTVWYRVTYDGFKFYISSNNVKLEGETDDSDEPESNDSANVKTSGLTYPESLNCGSGFTLKGTLSSDLKMTKVVTGITSSKGEWLSGYKVTSSPNSTSYDINKNVDPEISFGKLDAGTYYYKCEVTTSAGTETVFNKAFTIKAQANISVSGLTYPTVLNQYKSFTLKGKITSTETMSKIQVGITKSNGDWLSGHYVTVTPNAKTYQLSNVDSKIKFGDLSTGSYAYKCYVTTASGTQTLFTYSFTINKNKGIPSALSYGTLSGNKRNDIIKIAMAQAGYNTNKENQTVYNLWYYGSDTRAAWCAVFVSWCANKAGVSTGVIPKMAYVPSITSWYKNKGRFNAKKTLPKKGDLIIYSGSSHIGFVTEDVTSSSGYVSTLEGNTGNDEVKYRKNYMKWNCSSIQGYCRPNY